MVQRKKIKVYKNRFNLYYRKSSDSARSAFDTEISLSNVNVQHGTNNTLKKIIKQNLLIVTTVIFLKPRKTEVEGLPNSQAQLAIPKMLYWQFMNNMTFVRF